MSNGIESVVGNARRANLYCTKCSVFERQQEPLATPSYQNHARYKWCMKLTCTGTDCKYSWYVCTACSKQQNRYSGEKGVRYHQSKFHVINKRQQNNRNQKRKLECTDDDDHNRIATEHEEKGENDYAYSAIELPSSSSYYSTNGKKSIGIRPYMASFIIFYKKSSAAENAFWLLDPIGFPSIE